MQRGGVREKKKLQSQSHSQSQGQGQGQRNNKRQKRSGERENKEGEINLLFDDEGQRLLWLVEGLLLACWLSLQEDVKAVEYQPTGGEVFVLEGGRGGDGNDDLGKVLRRVVEVTGTGTGTGR